jgi:hypothetical protein
MLNLGFHVRKSYKLVLQKSSQHNLIHLSFNGIIMLKSNLKWKFQYKIRSFTFVSFPFSFVEKVFMLSLIYFFYILFRKYPTWKIFVNFIWIFKYSYIQYHLNFAKQNKFVMEQLWIMYCCASVIWLEVYRIILL